MSISVDVALYGSLAKFGGGKHLAQVDVRFNSTAQVQDLLAQLEIPPEDKGYVFINAVLCDVPGLNASQHESLQDGDHVGIFSLGYMWPYQYRDGMPMSESLKKAMRAYGALHHSYTKR